MSASDQQTQSEGQNPEDLSEIRAATDATKDVLAPCANRLRNERLIRSDVSRFDRSWCQVEINALSCHPSSAVSTRSLIAINRTLWSTHISHKAYASVRRQIRPRSS